MSSSPNLSMPYIQPAQAQKHVTHNEALEILDGLVQLSITDLNAVAPPVSPTDGQAVGVAQDATGAFADAGGKIAIRAGGGWLFVTPREGFLAWVEADSAIHVHREGSWHKLLALDDDRKEGLGINAAWDSTNRLAVAAPATLLSHEGAGHQLKINKAETSDTAGLVFQTGFSGRAEIGLTGNDDLSVKVSGDGTAWSTALSVNAATGDISLGDVRAASIGGAAVQEGPGDATPGRLMRADWGYGPATILGPVSEVDGRPSGALIESGQNERGFYARWADGTQECWGMLKINVASTSLSSLEYPVSFVGDRSMQCSSFSHLSGSPNEAILWSNIRAIGHDGYRIFARLLTAGRSSDPKSYEEAMGYRIIGRWF